MKRRLDSELFPPFSIVLISYFSALDVGTGNPSLDWVRVENATAAALLPSGMVMHLHFESFSRVRRWGMSGVTKAAAVWHLRFLVSIRDGSGNVWWNAIWGRCPSILSHTGSAHTRSAFAILDSSP